MNASSTTFFARRKRGIVVLVLAAGVLAVAGWFLLARLRGGQAAPELATAPAQRTDVVLQVTATGTLSPVVTVQVGSQVSGRIKELLVDYNSKVEAGQVIARIDPELFQSAVNQARARLRSAQAALARNQAVAANAKLTYERAVKLVEDGTVSRAEVDGALADHRSAKAQVQASAADLTLARAALEQVEANLAYTTISSPIDGVVISRNVAVGQTVAASLQAPTLFVIAGDLRQMEIHTAVAESDVGQIETGMKVEFTADAYPDRTFTGEVRQVRYESQTVSNVVTYDAVVIADNQDLALRPGMTANATFVIDERRDVLAVPTRALRWRPADAQPPGQPTARKRGEGLRTVYVLRDGQPVAVKIKTGLGDGTRVEVVGGELAEGDLVITGDEGAPAATGTQQQGGGANRRGGPPRLF